MKKIDMIEYLAPNGAAWNPYSGCLHGKDICATSATCWARALSKRFEQVCGGDFEPRFHPARLEVPLHWKKPRRVAVCFMGDLWGDWELPTWTDEIILAPKVINRTMGHLLVSRNQWMDCLREAILAVVEACPRHQFLFLTKRPEALVQFNPWPSNAWVGTSITGAETPARQVEMMEALHRVEGAGVLWLSYEPALGPLAIALPDWLDWFVVGAQSGKGAKPFDIPWLYPARNWGVFYNKPRWEKNNLARYLKRPPTQELPKEETP